MIIHYENVTALHLKELRVADLSGSHSRTPLDNVLILKPPLLLYYAAFHHITACTNGHRNTMNISAIPSCQLCNFMHYICTCVMTLKIWALENSAHKRFLEDTELSPHFEQTVNPDV